MKNVSQHSRFFGLKSNPRSPGHEASVLTSQHQH